MEEQAGRSKRGRNRRQWLKSASDRQVFYCANEIIVIIARYIFVMSHKYGTQSEQLFLEKMWLVITN